MATEVVAGIYDIRFDGAGRSDLCYRVSVEKRHVVVHVFRLYVLRPRGKLGMEMQHENGGVFGQCAGCG